MALNRIGIIVALLAAFCGSQRATAQAEFRIDSQIYLGDSKQPTSQNQTIFSNNMIYDFALNNEQNAGPIETTIFDRRLRKFILMDHERKIRLELFDAQVMQMAESLKQETRQNERTRFFVTDEFGEDYDLPSNWVTLQSDTLTYSFTGESLEDTTVLPQYHQFLDKFTLLQATDPKQLPPFARMRLNQTIKKYSWIPSEINLRVSKNDFFKRSIKITSKHTLVAKLSSKDRKLMKIAKSNWMSFEAVNLSQYRGISPKEITASKK